MKIKAFIFIIGVMFAYMQALQASEKEFTIYTENFPPYNYSDNGKIVGISSEIVKEMLKRLGHPDNIQLQTWSQSYNIVKKENNKILFSTTRTPAREKSFKWVGPLVPNNTVFFAKKDSKFSIKSLADAKGVKAIGVYKDDFGELLLKEKGFTNLAPVLDNKQNIAKLASGEIDLWIINELTGKHMIRGAGFGRELKKVYEVQKDYMYMAFSKSTPDSVIERWQKVLDEIKADGTYAQIFSRWIMFSYSDDLKPTKSSKLILSKEEKLWIKKHPVIKVATDPDYAPFQYTDENQNSQGLANDYLSLVAKKLGLKFEMVLTDNWNKSLESVKKRDNDMVVVAAKTPDREEYLSFTSPYAVFPDVIITRKNSKKISSIVELRGKTLATVKGFAINEYIKKYYPKVKLIFKPDVASVLKSISMGELDATVLNVATASNAIEKANITNLRVDGDTGFMYELSFASRNDWAMLNILLEKALKTITKEERKNLLHKWISVSYNTPKNNSISVELTRVEREWLNNHPIITLAPDPNWAPVEFFDEDGKYLGMTAEYIALLEERLKIKFHVLHLDSWDELLKKAMNGEIDVITAASNPKREKKLLFTEPYLTLPSVIIVNDKETKQLNMNDLKDKLVTVVSGYATQEYMEREYPDIHLKLVSSAQEGLHEVSYGSAYAFIGSIATTSYIIEKEMLLSLRVAGAADYSWKLGFASNNKEPILNQILSKGLESITKKERQNIFKKWILVTKEAWKPSKELIIAISVTLGILFIIAIIVWNRLLVKKVSQRTKELNKTLRTSEILREKADYAQQKAQEADKAKSIFLASMSHEIRTPMNAIIGMADLISRTELSKEQKEYVDIFQNAGENLLSIIDDILDISKIESGQLTLEKIPFNLKETVKKVYEIMSLNIHKDKVKLSFKIQDDVPIFILGDSVRLQQILINLVGNAIKFTHEGKVIILLEKAKNYEDTSILKFSVLDTGIGIAEDKRKSIFDSFAQADSSTTREFGGTGLGLTISKRLIQKMGGDIWIEENPDGGTIFHFSIKAPEQSGDMVQSKLSESKQNLKEVFYLNILVADDDPVNQKVATLMLESQKHTVTTVSDGLQAVDEVKSGNYDLIFMDVGMPNMDGYEATKVIREMEEGTELNIPIIALTALVFKEDKQKCLDVGMDYYVSKPFRNEKLLEAIGKFFGTAQEIEETTLPSNTNVIIDKEAAFSRAGNDWEALKMIADIYFEHSVSQLIKLKDAVKNRNIADIDSIAHGIKGTLGTLGSVSAFDTALKLEKAGKLEDLSDVEELFAAFISNVEEFNKELKIFIEEEKL